MWEARRCACQSEVLTGAEIRYRMLGTSEGERLEQELPKEQLVPENKTNVATRDRKAGSLYSYIC